MKLASMVIALLMIWGCTPAVDSDTEPTASNTARHGNDAITIVQATRFKRLTVPTYLPAWGPHYPGSDVRDKLVQVRDGKVIGRATTFVSDDPMETVISFYKQKIADSGVTIYGAEGRWTGNWSQAVEGEKTGYNNHIMVSRSNDVGTQRTFIKIVAATTK